MATLEERIESLEEELAVHAQRLKAASSGDGSTGDSSAGGLAYRVGLSSAALKQSADALAASTAATQALRQSSAAASAALMQEQAEASAARAAAMQKVPPVPPPSTRPPGSPAASSNNSNDESLPSPDGKVRCINCNELLPLPNVGDHRCGAGNGGDGGGGGGGGGAGSGSNSALSFKGMANKGMSYFGNKPG